VTDAVRGIPTVLATYTHEMTARVDASRGPVAEYSDAVRQLLAAPTELPVAVPDRSARLDTDLDELARLDRQPAVFAAALRLADRFPLAAIAVPPALALRVQQLLERADLDTQLSRHVAGERLAARLLEILGSNRDGDELRAQLATVLGGLDTSDPAMLAAFYDHLGAEGLLELLTSVEASIDPFDPDPDREGLAALLEPLGTSFANAARLGIVDAAFVDRLLADTTAGNRPDGGTTQAVAQLLLYGDPLRTGNVELTAGLASMVLADGFAGATRWMQSGTSPWYREGGDALGDGDFHIEAQVARAAEALIDHPEAAYGFLLLEGNQRALLDRADEGWWLASEHGASEVLEAGLLRHPLDAGLLDDLRPGADLPVALGGLIAEVARRDAVDASVSRGLGNVLAPHGDSVAHAASDDAVGPDVLGVDQETMRRYLANTLRHEPGGDALTAVFASWTEATFAEWAPRMVPEQGVTTPIIESDYVLDLVVVRDQYTLLEHALADAGQSYVDDHRLLYLVVDEADRAARSAVVRELGWSGGIKGRLASEALGRATSAGTDALKDRIEAAGPGSVEDLQAALHVRMPNAAIAMALDVVDEERFEELVPVDVGDRPVEVAGSFFDRIAPWRDDTRVELVPFEQWDAAQRDDWLSENRAALEERGLDEQESRRWWLNVHVRSVGLGFQPPPSGS
jgi:hypothetical protein